MTADIWVSFSRKSRRHLSTITKIVKTFEVTEMQAGMKYGRELKQIMNEFCASVKIVLTALIEIKETTNYIASRICSSLRKKRIVLAEIAYLDVSIKACMSVDKLNDSAIKKIYEHTAVEGNKVPNETFTSKVRRLLAIYLDDVDPPSYDLRCKVARICKLSIDQINGWIYNRRSRQKRKRHREILEDAFEDAVLDLTRAESEPSFENGSLLPFDIVTNANLGPVLLIEDTPETVSPFRPGTVDNYLFGCACDPSTPLLVDQAKKNISDAATDTIEALAFVSFESGHLII